MASTGVNSVDASKAMSKTARAFTEACTVSAWQCQAIRKIYTGDLFLHSTAKGSVIGHDVTSAIKTSQMFGLLAL